MERAVFTSGRILGGQLPFQKEHFRRLQEGAAWLGASVGPNFWSALESDLKAWIAREEEEDRSPWAVRAQLTLGEHGILSPAFFRRHLEHQDLHPPAIRMGLAQGVRYQDQVPPDVKCTQYDEATEHKRQALERGMDDVCFYTPQGLLSEASTSNVFLLMEDAIWTPAARPGVLKGIARQVLLRGRSELGLPVLERDVLSADLSNAREVWLTNSVRGIIPVSGVEGKDYPCHFVETVKKYYSQALLIETRR